MEYKNFNKLVDFIKTLHEENEEEYKLDSSTTKRLVDIFYYVDLLEEEFESENIEFEYDEIENQLLTVMRFDDVIFGDDSEHKFFEMIQPIDGMSMYYDEGEIVIEIRIEKFFVEEY